MIFKKVIQTIPKINDLIHARLFVQTCHIISINILTDKM